MKRSVLLKYMNRVDGGLFIPIGAGIVFGKNTPKMDTVRYTIQSLKNSEKRNLGKKLKLDEKKTRGYYWQRHNRQ